MTGAFVDTGVWFAYLVVEDARHEQARELIDRAMDEDWDLLTTNAVMLETHAFLVSRARGGHSLALGFLASLDDGIAQLERFTEQDEAAAIALVRGHSDKGYSLCDALSFVVMERLGVKNALSFDRHFHQYGRFSVLN